MSGANPPDPWANGNPMPRMGGLAEFLDAIPTENHGNIPGRDPGDWHPTKAGIAYITPAEGGVQGTSKVVGWNTGFAGPNQRHQRFTGRAIVPPSTNVNAGNGGRGPVGRDNFAQARENALVQQTTDYLPDLHTIAASYSRGWRGGL